MRVRTDHLGKAALFALVLHAGVTIGRHAQAPTFVVLPPPLESPKEIVTTSVRAQKLVDPNPELLPALENDLPEMGTKEFDHRMREMGLESSEVAKFAQMMQTQDLAAFQK